MIWNEIDVEGWYAQGSPLVDAFAPERPAPVLKLKPEMAPLIVEEDDERA